MPSLSDRCLPPGWGQPQWFTETVDIHGAKLSLAGVCARAPSGEMVSGSAAALDGDPRDRALFELLERSSIVAAMSSTRHFEVRDASGRLLEVLPSAAVFPATPDGSSWTFSRSNGVALHDSWAGACERAYFELVERDRLLRSWFGELTPERVALPERALPTALSNAYAFEAFSFGASDREVMGIFGFPTKNGPMAYGFSAAADAGEALERAAAECVQRIGFLWGEPLPEREPEPLLGPSFHQEFFLFPPSRRRLVAWLRGEHRGRCTLRSSQLEPAQFVDLTPAAFDGLFVAKAIPRGELQLTFGVGHPGVTGALPRELSVHPIA